MKSLGSFMTSVYREESKSLCQHTVAMCKAIPLFLPIVLDKTGWKNGREYRYASIHSIRRSTQPALCLHGLVLAHIYGHSDEGEHVTTVLRHDSGEWQASTLKVRPHLDPQDQKAERTGLCRTAIEGLLSVICEDDGDDDFAGIVAADTDEANALVAQTMSLEMAFKKIAAATDATVLDGYLVLASQRIAEGVLATSALTEINQRVALRRAQLGVASDRDNATVGAKSKDDDGSISSGNAGGTGRATKSGRGDLPAGVQRAGATA